MEDAQTIATEPAVLVRVLGPVEVDINGVRQPIPGVRRRTVLAAIALDHDELIGLDRLIEAVWGGHPPATVANTLQRHVSYLRKVLDRWNAIVALPNGYGLNREVVTTDAVIAQGFIRDAAAMPDPVDRAAQLRAALDLWRGEALSDTAGGPWMRGQAQRLEYLRLDALEAFVDARLALGEHPRLISELEVLTDRHPFREKLCQQLMLALYRSGRPADALAAYRRLRTFINRELGIEPNPALRELEVAIMRQDTALERETSGDRMTIRPAWPIPAQLPPAMPTFTGRAAELARLGALLDPDTTHPTGGSRIIAITGTAGVGKTTLALRCAHNAAPLFPDGQLYVNLRGFDPTAAVLPPGRAIRGFLQALGIPGDHIPDTTEARTALFRSIVASKRLLLVIDNARDEDHVRPLLPGTPASVLITSRNQLAGLAAAEGVHLAPLHLPPVDEARDMLVRRLGTNRTLAEPDAVDEIVACCARLPLALAVAAARAAADPTLPLRSLAAQLGSTHPLDGLHTTDPTTNVRSVFSSSYETLSPAAARVFRYLGGSPGPDISTDAVASLTGLSRDAARSVLTELAGAHLVIQDTPGRYTFHDLLRAYAKEQAQRPSPRSAGE